MDPVNVVGVVQGLDEVRLDGARADGDGIRKVELGHRDRLLVMV